MRISVLIIISYLFAGNLFAQQTDLQVVGSAGNSFVIPGLQLDWTVGEPVIQTLENTQGILTQGFHQPDYRFITSVTETNFTGDFRISPVPASGEITIELAFPEFQSGILTMYDMAGKKIRSISFSGEKIVAQHSITDLTPGQYIFQAQLADQHKAKSIHFIKI